MLANGDLDPQERMTGSHKYRKDVYLSGLIFCNWAFLISSTISGLTLAGGALYGLFDQRGLVTLASLSLVFFIMWFISTGILYVIYRKTERKNV